MGLNPCLQQPEIYTGLKSRHSATFLCVDTSMLTYKNVKTAHRHRVILTDIWKLKAIETVDAQQLRIEKLADPDCDFISSFVNDI